METTRSGAKTPREPAGQARKRIITARSRPLMARVGIDFSRTPRRELRPPNRRQVTQINDLAASHWLIRARFSCWAWRMAVSHGAKRSSYSNEISARKLNDALYRSNALRIAFSQLKTLLTSSFIVSVRRFQSAFNGQVKV